MADVLKHELETKTPNNVIIRDSALRIIQSNDDYQTNALNIYLMSLIKLGDFETALSFLNDPRNHPNQNIDPNIILMVLSHCKIDLSKSHEYFRHILGKSEISDQYGVLYELITNPDSLNDEDLVRFVDKFKFQNIPKELKSSIMANLIYLNLKYSRTWKSQKISSATKKALHEIQIASKSSNKLNAKSLKVLNLAVKYYQNEDYSALDEHIKKSLLIENLNSDFSNALKSIQSIITNSAQTNNSPDDLLKNPSLDSPAELITSLGSIYDLLNSGEDFENSWKIAQLIENLPPMLKNNKIISAIETDFQLYQRSQMINRMMYYPDGFAKDFIKKCGRCPDDLFQDPYICKPLKKRNHRTKRLTQPYRFPDKWIPKTERVVAKNSKSKKQSEKYVKGTQGGAVNEADELSLDISKMNVTALNQGAKQINVASNKLARQASSSKIGKKRRR